MSGAQSDKARGQIFCQERSVSVAETQLDQVDRPLMIVQLLMPVLIGRVSPGRSSADIRAAEVQT